MYDFSIGVMLESFKLPIPEAIKKAKELCLLYTSDAADD